MPRKKGTPKTGGRRKGTPNKATAAVKSVIADVLNAYMLPTDDGTQPNLQTDLAAMQPESRVRAMTNLAAFVIPKQQALTIDEQTQVEADALTQWLETAPAEAIDAIAAKILEIQQQNV